MPIINIITFSIVPISADLVTATRADNYSPDSILKVFKNNQEITFAEIKYNDGVKLCGSKGVVTRPLGA